MMQKVEIPLPKLKSELLKNNFEKKELVEIEQSAIKIVASDYQKALQAEDPKPEDLFDHNFAPHLS